MAALSAHDLERREDTAMEHDFLQLSRDHVADLVEDAFDIEA